MNMSHLPPRYLHPGKRWPAFPVASDAGKALLSQNRPGLFKDGGQVVYALSDLVRWARRDTSGQPDMMSQICTGCCGRVDDVEFKHAPLPL